MSDPRPPEDEFVVYDHDGAADPNADTQLLGHRYERTELVAYGADWDMAAWIAADRAARAEAGAFDAGGHTEVVAPSFACPLPELPKGNCRSVAARAAAAGWDVRAQASIVYVTPTLFVASTEGEDGHSKGDLRYQDHDDTWWGVQAVLRREGTLVASFWAEWVTKEQVGAKPATSYRDAHTFDIVTKRAFASTWSDFSAWFDVFAPPPPRKRGPRA